LPSPKLPQGQRGTVEGIDQRRLERSFRAQVGWALAILCNIVCGCIDRSCAIGQGHSAQGDTVSQTTPSDEQDQASIEQVGPLLTIQAGSMAAEPSRPQQRPLEATMRGPGTVLQRDQTMQDRIAAIRLTFVWLPPSMARTTRNRTATQDAQQGAQRQPEHERATDDQVRSTDTTAA